MPDALGIMTTGNDGHNIGTSIDHIENADGTGNEEVWIKIEKECLDNIDKGFVDFMWMGIS